MRQKQPDERQRVLQALVTRRRERLAMRVADDKTPGAKVSDAVGRERRRIAQLAAPRPQC